MSELPSGWAHATLDTITEHRSGNSKLIKGRLASEPRDGLYPAFSASGQDVWVDEPQYTGNAIIVSAVGARCGKTFLARGSWSAIANTHIVIPKETVVDVAWLQRLLNDESFWEKGGTAQPFVLVRKTFEREVSLPPLAEQRRIVAKLDSLTARTARARSELDHIPRLVEKYKQAILGEAFSGELTREWRGQQRKPIQPAYDDAGIDGRAAERPSIPAAWTWTSFGAAGAISGGLTKSPKRDLISTRSRYLRVANVYANELRLDEISEIGCTKAELEKTKLKHDDLLIVEGNGSLEQIGRVAIWAGEIEDCSHQNHIIRARMNLDVYARYALYWLLSPLGRSYIERVASSSAGLHTLSISKVQGLPLPLCSIDEQKEAVRLIDTAFAWLDKVTAEHARASHLVPKLDQSILAKAFRGELVPQDPNDEPASVLLERIKAASGEAKTTRGGRGKRKGS